MSLPGDSFHTTRWTRVVAARGDSPDAQEALSDLCALNYAPVLRFLRASGHSSDEAQELAHEFFAEVLARRNLDGSDPARGRFRSYLLGALKHFLAKRRAHHACQKRGAGLPSMPWPDRSSTDHGPVPDELRTEASSDALFDREWALGILARALALIERQHVESGTYETFVQLKPWLSAGTAPPAQAEVAGHLQLGEGALKVAIHRLRKRFRAAVRGEVAQTLHDQSELAEEMQHLISVLSI